jgi:hypothetical protein
MRHAVDSIVGFAVSNRLAPERVDAALSAQRRVVGYFPHLRTLSLAIGASRLELWGHGDVSSRVTRLDDGSVLALVGSPHGRVSWSDLPAVATARLGYEDDLELPWEGRVVLLRVSADGAAWTMWNDWVGSIPVFHAKVGPGRVASTLEPVVVSAARFSAGDISLPGLIAMFINGHYLGDWTLFAGMKVAPPDSVSEWGDGGFRTRRVWAVRPSDDLAEEPWTNLVDRMFELSREAICSAVDGTSSWALGLSGGLDSRLIAAVCAGQRLDVRAYAWGTGDTVDVVYSREIARALGLPWQHIGLGTDYLGQYTRLWAAWFGSSLHFHGMYQMAFLDAIAGRPPGCVLHGFLGDVLFSSPLYLDSDPRECQLADLWHTHWTLNEVRALLKVPVDDAIEELAAGVAAQISAAPGRRFKRAIFADVWNRQRLFTAFQATLGDHWRGVVTPFVDRPLARFCLALPRPALEGKRLLADVYRSRYALIATIPGTYGPEPFIPTGRYLLKRRLARVLPPLLKIGPLRGFRDIPPRMDLECVQAHGWKALWPIADCRDRLAEWVDLARVDEAYATVMSSKEDMRPLRKLQSVQALAYRLLHS